MSRIGIVVIGRNEGERLRRCLESVRAINGIVVYVDSGSSDDSVNLAYQMGADVVNLDMTRPFNAARARNEGYQRLTDIHPDLDLIQFVDGDCEIAPGWFLAAMSTLESSSDVAIVAGLLKERFPQHSIYNRLGELEWNMVCVGEVDAVGGIFIVRQQVFASVGGFDPTVAAGEEPELCRRISMAGWRILRIAEEMAWHDLAMTHFKQWWRRQVRNGRGSLDVARRFRLRNFVRSCWRARFWSIWPFLVLMAFTIHALMGISILALWPLQMTRIAVRTWQNGQPAVVALAHGWFTMLSYWPQSIGQLYYLTEKLGNNSPRIIEYKSAG